MLLLGILPAAFAVAMGILIGAVRSGQFLVGPLAFAGGIFILLQVLNPITPAVSTNLGDRTAAWLCDRLTEACVRPFGIGHLEDSSLTTDLTVARDFDLGMTGPPLSIAMDFIASGMITLVTGLASAVIVAAYHWWAGVILAGACLRPITFCVRVACGTIATHPRSEERSATPTTVTVWPSIHRRARSCACLVSRAGR